MTVALFSVRNLIVKGPKLSKPKQCKIFLWNFEFHRNLIIGMDATLSRSKIG